MAATVQAIARLQDRDVTRVVGRSSVFAARMYRIAREAAERGSTQFDTKLIRAAQDELVDLMVWAYLLRTRLATRRRTMGKEASKGIELASPVSRLASKASQELRIDLGNLRERFTTLTGRTLRRELQGVRKILRTGLNTIVRKGGSTPDLVAYLKKRGLKPRSFAYIDTIVRAHVGIAYGLAHRAAYAGDPDLWGFEYATMEDERVRESHEILHGVRRRWDDEFWDLYWPPNGWGCRCQPVALYGRRIRQTPVPKGAKPDTLFKEQYASLRLAHEKSFEQKSLVGHII